MGAVHSKQWDEIFKNVGTLTNEKTNEATGYVPNDMISGKVQRIEVQENLDPYKKNEPKYKHKTKRTNIIRRTRSTFKQQQKNQMDRKNSRKVYRSELNFEKDIWQNI
jgi:hypothetical protein